MAENNGEVTLTDKEYQELLNVALDVGHFLSMAGAEVYRVEETIQRILYAYGAKHVDVFAITSQITVTLTLPNRSCFTRMRRIYSRGTDYTMLEQLNHLSREICAEKPPVEVIQQKLKTIYHGESYSEATLILAYGAISFFFTLFFGGNLRDACGAFVAGVIVRMVLMMMGYLHANRFFINMVASFAVVLVASASIRLNLANHLDYVVIGTLMTLVPGVAITNSVRDIIAGDLLAGSMKALEAFLVAAALAMGAGMALILTGGV